MPTYWLSDSQKFGVGFCTGGFFFLLFGLILFFDRALLAMGNILFLIGVTLLLGPTRTFAFFARKQKWRGSLAFWAGILLILIKWTFVGFAVESYGIFVLFGEYVSAFIATGELGWWGRFFKTIAGFAYNIPVVGPYLARALQVAGDKAGANERAHKDLPV
ncbi:Golgi Transport [Recurvomyces mirabilis]|uniref:Golgi Transport n=1 Tax=Recurvomyces mirabilis TaxID=574656 RepID=A0AAE1C5V9_9PEZI|nr:Golgi Transport [Recurvomyces mirabilis]KAK5158769.1 Golgi Transport [Recurvomyces mirabilis]